MNRSLQRYNFSHSGNFSKEIGPHILFWVLYFTFNVLRWGSYFDDYVYSFNSNLVEFAVHISLVYFNLYFLWPRFLPQRYGVYLFLLLIATLVMTFIRIVITYEFVTTDIYKESDLPASSIFDFNYVLAGFIGELYVIGFTTAIKITIDYIRNLQKTKELEKQSLQHELSMLKSQLQPHFFFNTLNNLYALTLEKSNEAPETVIKLSQFMSYVIYQGNKKTVPLSDEIKYIQNYIDLEQLRFGQRVQVDFKVKGSTKNKKIPPLLLLPFIENAFKHGTHFETTPVYVSIDIEIQETTLIFKTANKKNPEKVIDKKSSGIGLSNTKRRLGLLYGENYDLTIDEDHDIYTITLNVPFKK